MSDNQNPGQGQGQGNNRQNTPADYGRQIGDTVRSALQSGDLSRLRDIGPAVQGIVKSTTDNIGVQINSAVQQTPQHRQNQNVNTQQPYGGLRPAPQQRPQQQMSSYRRGPGNMSGVGNIVLGTIGVTAFGLSGLALGVTVLIGLATSASVFLGGVLLGATGLSAVLLGSGVSKRNLASRVRQYYAVLAQKGYATFEELAAHVGQPVEKVKKDVRKALHNGMMTDTRVDAAETTVMVGEEAYKTYMETEEARQKREEEEAERLRRLADPSTAGIEQFKQDGNAALASLRKANKAIPGEEISGKIDKLETTVSKIIAYVVKHPEKLPETRQLMNYYLPTTLKMLDKYRQYEEMEVQLANVQQTKVEIERSLDTINIAFENLLTSLYKEDTLDVSTDIKVLKTVLQQEGLVGHQFVVETERAEKEESPAFKEE